MPTVRGVKGDEVIHLIVVLMTLLAFFGGAPQQGASPAGLLQYLSELDTDERQQELIQVMNSCYQVPGLLRVHQGYRILIFFQFSRSGYGSRSRLRICRFLIEAVSGLQAGLRKMIFLLL